MSEARAAVLARIRSVPRADIPRTEAAYRRAGAREQSAIVDLFCARVADYKADVTRVASIELAEVLTHLCRGRFAVPPGWPDALCPPHTELVRDDCLPPRALDSLDGVLTGCTLAIAETGTIALSGDALEGRRALTLVPDVHVCLVAADQIVETVPEAIRRLGLLTRETHRPLTLISGPSATSDIELSRVEGVHGPRTLCVVVYE